MPIARKSVAESLNPISYSMVIHAFKLLIPLIDLVSQVYSGFQPSAPQFQVKPLAKLALERTKMKNSVIHIQDQ